MNFKKPWSNSVNTIIEVNEIINNLSKDKIIVYTYGVWDLFQPGHLRLLHRARMLGDFLVVGVVSDLPVKELKGDDRPTQGQEERLLTVGGARCVDVAVPQKLYDPSAELKSLKRINILTKGDDWDYIPGQETIEALGGQLVKLSYTKGFSTSQTVKKMKHVK